MAPPSLVAHDALPALGGPDPGALDRASALASTRVALGQIELIPGIKLGVALSLDRASLTIDLHVGGLFAWSTTLAQDKLTDRWTAHQGLFKEDLAFTVDLGLGELSISGDACVFDGSWRCARFDDVVLRWAPAIGAVVGDPASYAPVIVDPTLGSSRSIVPTMTRIFVDAIPRHGTPVGQIVKDAYFAKLPGFVFNVAFSVGDFPVGGAGPYTDPQSPWFNLFAGYYQIDCPKPAWSRPFGYDLAPGGAATVRFDDLLAIGKADWNYFSNWMYGVPAAAILPFQPIEPGVPCQVIGRQTIGGGSWDVVDIDGFSVVTASAPGGSAALVDNSVITPLWRVTYGEPTPVPDGAPAFPGARMHARFLVCYAETEAAFHTWFFGGTVNKTFDGPANDRLLDEQMKAAVAVIANHYPALGFR